VLHVENLIEEQASDPRCRHRSTLVGASPSIDFGDFEALGQEHQSGEFQLALPTTLAKSSPHTFVTEQSVPHPDPHSYVLGDASLIRREVVLTNSSPLTAHAVTEAIIPQALQLE
jgi:hypothetical protein